MISGMGHERRLAGSFDAAGDDGRTYHVQVVEAFESNDPGDGFSAGVGETTLATEGFAVERVAKGRYRIAVNGVTLTTDDPAAP
jgi:hypothetical protein